MTNYLSCMFAVAESLQSTMRLTVWNQLTTRCQDIIASTGHLIVYNPLQSVVRRLCFVDDLMCGLYSANICLT